MGEDGSKTYHKAAKSQKEMINPPLAAPAFI
jgi:hypothetical protein